MVRKPHKSTLRALARRFRSWFVTLPETSSFDQDLCCACAVASEALARFLRREGFDARFVEGQYVPWDLDGDTNHCWVEVGKWIVDITATQFATGRYRLPEVYIVPVGHKDFRSKRRGQYALRIVRKIWPRDQRPLGRHLRIPATLP